MVSPDTLKAFGTELRAARVAAGWTLAQLAEAAFDNPDRKGFVSQIENGRKQITPLTVGRLAEALDLPNTIVRPMLTNADTTEDAVTDQDRRAEHMLRQAEQTGEGGIAETLMIALAYEYAEGDTPDLDSAYKGLRLALETAREMKARAALPDNTDAGISAVRAEVQRLNEADQVEDAGAAIDAAIEQQKAGMAALLELGLQQDRLRNDPARAAERLVAGLMLEEPKDVFNSLRALQDVWYVKGRDAGLAYEAQVAIHLAERTVDHARSADERGAALNDLAIALKTLGERSSDTKLLEQAVAAYRDALLEYTRDRAPLNWATTQNNLGNALQTLGERSSDTALLEQAVAAYRDALLERTRDRVPLLWAQTQQNLGTALQIVGEHNSDSALLKQAVVAYREALQELVRERVPHSWAMTQFNLGNALRILGKCNSDAGLLEQAVTAYRDALLERTRERIPLGWATTHFNLALLHLTRWEMSKDPPHLRAARADATAAMEIFEAAQASHYIELAQQLLAKIDANS